MLTDTACKKAKPTGKRARLYDTGGCIWTCACRRQVWRSSTLRSKEKCFHLAFTTSDPRLAREKRDEARKLFAR